MLADVGKVDDDELAELVKQIVYCNHGFINHNLLHLKLDKKNYYKNR